MAVPRLSDLIIKYKERSNLSYSQIGKRANIPHRTIQSWAKEYSKHPRRWQDLVQFAGAVDLNQFEVDEVLQTAGHPTVEILRRRGEDLHLLRKWEQKRSVFQIPRMAAARYRGRISDQAKIEARLFSREKMCILQGMGGVGKTSLAIFMGQKLLHKFPDGLLWADLRRMGAVEILNSWAHALGVELPPSKSVEAQAASMSGILSRKTVLIILDDIVNIKLARLLLPAYQTPCSILATTRSKAVANALVTDPRNLISLEPMRPNTSLQVVQDVLGQDAVDTQRATIDEICDLLGHLPLALNIFARRQRISLMSVEKTLDKLKDIKTRLESLKLGDEAVRTAFEQSWEQLNTQLQDAFKAMAVFSGRSFQIEDFSKITGQSLLQTEELVDQLQNLFLVEQINDNDSRFIQHPLLASWASELMDKNSPLWLAMAKHYLHFAQEYKNSQIHLLRDWKNIMAGMEEAYRNRAWELVLEYEKVLSRVWTEQGQFNAAREAYLWASEAALDTEKTVELGSIYLNWAIACIEQSDYDEGAEKLQKSMQIIQEEHLLELRGRVHEYFARTYLEQGKYSDSYQELQNAWKYYQQTEDLLGMANTLYQMGDLQYYKGNREIALSLGEDSLNLHIRLDNKLGQMQTLQLLATTAAEANDLDLSQDYITRAEEILDKITDKAKKGGFYYSCANLFRLQQKFERADEFLTKSLALFRQTGSLMSEANVLNLFALNELDRSIFLSDIVGLDKARAYAQNSLELCKKIHFEQGQVTAHLSIGKAYFHQQDLAKACEIWRQALKIAEKSGHNFFIKRLKELLSEAKC